MSNVFSTRSNKDIKLISSLIIEQTFFCQNFIWNSRLNSASRITRPKQLGPVGKNSLNAAPIMAGAPEPARRRKFVKFTRIYISTVDEVSRQ